MVKRDPESQSSADAQSKSASKPNGKPHTLHVKVVHGDFRKSASFPLVFGHYDDDTIVDVEAEIDEWMSGRLSRRYRLGVYPGPLGTVEVLHAPGTRGPRTVLVVGLGAVGDLSMDDIAKGVKCAVMRNAAELEGWSAGPDEGNGLSFLLVGSKSPRLAIEDSVLGVVRGVLMANRLLRPAAPAGADEPATHSGPTRRLHVDTIEFVELYERRAETAARVVRGLAKHPELLPDERIEAASYIDVPRGDRGRHEPQDQAATWSRRLLITDNGHDGLHYLFLGDNTRAEGNIIGPHRANIDGFFASIAGSTQWDEDAAATLFHLMLPNELKARVAAERSVVLVFQRGEGLARASSQADQGALPPTHYPWELIGGRQGDTCEPLALRNGFVRQLRVDDAPPRAVAAGRNVLVIGNPKADRRPDAPDPLPDLPGAAEEAKAVKATLEQAHYIVHDLVGTDSHAVLKALFRKEWLVLHVAGHGHYVADDRSRSGVYLDNGMRLTAGEILQLPVVPSLVFLNCCYSGMLDATPHSRLAATVAEQLIGRGVRAVVAAGWAVNDAAALTFAETFYAELAAGVPFGEALLQARCATREAHPGLNTWAAYQAYGDPGFVLDVHRRSKPKLAKLDPPVSLREYRVQLAAFGRKPPRDPREARAQLDVLLQSAAPDWRNDPVAHELTGVAWKHVGDFDAAVAAYRSAVKPGSGDVSLRALLQLSNLEFRRTVGCASPPPVDELREALARIERVIALQPSGEAWAVKGSALKRLAVGALREPLRPGATVRDVLAEAARAYADALRVDEPSPEAGRMPGGVAFPMLNRLTLEWLLGQVDDLERRLEDVERAAKPPEQAETLFERAVPANVRLLRWLAQGAPVGEAGEVVQCYLDARQDASEGEFLSSVEQAEWLVQARRTLVGLSPAEGEREPTRKGHGASSAEERLRAALQALAELAQAPPADNRPARPAKRPRKA